MMVWMNDGKRDHTKVCFSRTEEYILRPESDQSLEHEGIDLLD